MNRIRCFRRWQWNNSLFTVAATAGTEAQREGIVAVAEAT
uniref:Uncharacterized protein n=1 Tax=Setaria italica TaxID=4555 RepID=K3Z1V3_SETIT